jgi:hypothetical protein
VNGSIKVLWWPLFITEGQLARFYLSGKILIFVALTETSMVPFVYCVIFIGELLLCFLIFVYHAALTSGSHCFSVPSSYEGDAFDLKITAELNAFNIFICDQKSNIAEIKIHGK